MDPFSLGLGVWVAAGASQPGLWEVGLQGSRLVVCWGSGTGLVRGGGGMHGRAVGEWVGSRPRAAILSSRNICPCSHVAEDVPQRSALKY